MKQITITIEDGKLTCNCVGFESDFEINGLLQTILMHRCLNQFGVPSGVVEEIAEPKTGVE